jgi:hypothetical protein
VSQGAKLREGTSARAHPVRLYLNWNICIPGPTADINNAPLVAIVANIFVVEFKSR